MPNFNITNVLTVLLEYIDSLIQLSTNAFSIMLALAMRNAFYDPLCWHNR